MSDADLGALGSHLEGIHVALRSLARHLARRSGTAAVQRQLEWAASHLGQAIGELRAGEDGAGGEAPPGGLPLDEQEGLMDGLRGTTRSITLSEILGFIATLRKSGVLRVSSGAECFLVQLEDGHVVYAQSDTPPPGQRLGEILAARGAVARETLERLAAERRADGVLGQRLVEQGLVDPAELKQALSYQIQCIFHRLFHARGALFQFDEGVSVISSDDVRLNVTSLLLESARSSDELARDPRHQPDLAPLRQAG